MTDLTEIAARVEAATAWLRGMAVTGAQVLNTMSDHKTARNRAAGDPDATYGHITKEQTHEWRAAVLIEELSAEHARLTAEVERLRAALEPFAKFAADNIDENGWNSNIHWEAISTWFGPSDFRCAATEAGK